MSTTEINRAIDLGYGWTKVSAGDGVIKSFQSLPWRNPRTLGTGESPSQVMTVVVEGVSYGVSDEPEIYAPHGATRTRGDGYISSDHYAICMAAAVKVMRVSTINRLVVGTPVGNYEQARKELMRRFDKGITFDTVHVPISRLQVIPQPIGGLAFHIHDAGGSEAVDEPRLLVDVGYGTLDWVWATGARVNAERSGSSSNGVASFIDAVYRAIHGDTHGLGQDLLEVASIDKMLSRGKPFTLNGERHSRETHEKLIDALARTAFNELLQRVGSLRMCHSIVLMGGGAEIYKKAVMAAAGRVPVRLVREPQWANIRGFQLLADRGLLDRNSRA